MLSYKIAIPDVCVLIALARLDLLGCIFNVGEDMRLEMTDVVRFEATYRAEAEDARRIEAFLDHYKDRITIAKTSFEALLDAGVDLPEDAGAMSIYGYVNHQVSITDALTIVLDDQWYANNQVGHRPGTQFESLSGFLRRLKHVGRGRNGGLRR